MLRLKSIVYVQCYAESMIYNLYDGLAARLWRSAPGAASISSLRARRTSSAGVTSLFVARLPRLRAKTGVVIGAALLRAAKPTALSAKLKVV